MKFFNTEGPMKPDIHYCIPPLTRWNLPEILTLIEQQKYFVVHAPRQTGKTTCLLALQKYLNQQGAYRAVYVNVEAAQAAREDVAAAMAAIVYKLAEQARASLQDARLANQYTELTQRVPIHAMLSAAFTELALASETPLVLLLDEIDSLIGDTLISVLRQLREGYPSRPARFPQSVILCGVRDVRDYRLRTDDGKAVITGGSAFNIKAKSLRLGNFSQDEIAALYQQHTDATGQAFAADVPAYVMAQTNGQPWLVNALAQEVCFEMDAGRDRSRPISLEMIDQAKERLILRRDTHLDQLIDKLREPRIRRVIEPALTGLDATDSLRPDDVQYAIDLGLIQQERNGAMQIANAIYQEIIPRELVWDLQSGVTQQTIWYLTPENRLDMAKLLRAFQEFFREHSEHWIERFDYKEAGPQLLLQAFLQRIVNGGGRVEREYGLGRLRTDLLILWPTPAGMQKIVLELKLLRKTLDKTIEQGMMQTAEYLDRTGTAEGHLMIFDRTQGKTWDEKIFCQEREHAGHRMTIWGC